MALCNTFARQLRFSTYEDTITTEIGKLTFSIAAMLSAAEWLSNTDVSYLILLVSPRSDHKKHTIIIPARYVYIMLRDHLRVKTLQETAGVPQSVNLRHLPATSSRTFTIYGE
jgi:hypothetical protein